MTRPLIVDIKRHSLEDGPGIRSVVFFKGCPLRCAFCQNPEAQEFAAEIVFRATACIGCRACVAACPSRAIGAGPELRSREMCTMCGACTHACPSGALALLGQGLSLEEIVDTVLRDAAYYRHSGGGVTLSGGECTAFPEFAGTLLGRLRAQGIHTAVETCGEFSLSEFSTHIFPHLDLILFDLKLADSAAHTQFTGHDNERIWCNLESLLEVAAERVQIRIPLVPGITATKENLGALATRAFAIGARNLTLLPYNPLGAAMAANLGRAYPAGVPTRFTSPEETRNLIAWFADEVAGRFSRRPAWPGSRTAISGG